MKTYDLCKQLLIKGKLTLEMLDVFFAAGRLTGEQYSELVALLNSSKTDDTTNND